MDKLINSYLQSFLIDTREQAISSKYDVIDWNEERIIYKNRNSNEILGVYKNTRVIYIADCKNHKTGPSDCDRQFIFDAE